jgi:hypothetical protein
VVGHARFRDYACAIWSADTPAVRTDAALLREFPPRELYCADGMAFPPIRAAGLTSSADSFTKLASRRPASSARHAAGFATSGIADASAWALVGGLAHIEQGESLVTLVGSHAQH